MKRQLTAIIEREGDGYVSLCPELDIASQGESIEAVRKISRKPWNYFLSQPREEIKDRLREEVYITQVEVAVAVSFQFFPAKRFVKSYRAMDCNEVRRRGSHIVMQKMRSGSTITRSSS